MTWTNPPRASHLRTNHADKTTDDITAELAQWHEWQEWLDEAVEGDDREPEMDSVEKHPDQSDDDSIVWDHSMFGRIDLVDAQGNIIPNSLNLMICYCGKGKLRTELRHSFRRLAGMQNAEADFFVAGQAISEAQGKCETWCRLHVDEVIRKFQNTMCPTHPPSKINPLKTPELQVCYRVLMWWCCNAQIGRERLPQRQEEKKLRQIHGKMYAVLHLRTGVLSWTSMHSRQVGNRDLCNGVVSRPI